MLKKTTAQLKREIAELLKNRSRTFMEPQVTDERLWAEIETNEGTSIVPADVLSGKELAAAKIGDFDPLLKYTEGSRVYSDQSRLVRGYGVQLSAPGYMDATEWEVFPTQAEALQRAIELTREYEGDED